MLHPIKAALLVAALSLAACQSTQSQAPAVESAAPTTTAAAPSAQPTSSHDGVWRGENHSGSGTGARCDTRSYPVKFEIRNGQATWQTSSSRDGSQRLYKGTVKGDSLELVADSGQVWTITFNGDTLTGTRSSLQCQQVMTAKRVSK